MMPVFWLSPSLTEPRGRQVAMPWSKFEKRVEQPKLAASKESLARLAPVEFRGGYRCLANVIRVHAAVFDIDDGSDLATILVPLEGLYAIVHSTFSATEARTRWRVIMPLDRPVDAEGYDRVWRWLAFKLEQFGISPDYGARDASRAWAVPARPPNGFYVARVAGGAFASTSEAFAAVPKPEPQSLPPRFDRGDSYDRRLERASKYIDTMPAAISGSQGHVATFRVALVLVRGFGLHTDDALRLLAEEYNPRCLPPWSLPELRHKVRQAVQRGRLPHGYLADRARWERTA
jgi:hypothetical protein